MKKSSFIALILILIPIICLTIVFLSNEYIYEDMKDKLEQTEIKKILFAKDLSAYGDGRKLGTPFYTICDKDVINEIVTLLNKSDFYGSAPRSTDTTGTSDFMSFIDSTGEEVIRISIMIMKNNRDKALYSNYKIDYKTYRSEELYLKFDNMGIINFLKDNN